MKRKVFNSIIIMTILLSLGSVYSQSPDTVDLDKKIKRLEDNVHEIRRDQLNYQIEKDLLKEAFSSNYQTVNIVLAIILSLFTIIGFFGIRDIGKIRKDYQDELGNLQNIRRDFESRARELAEEMEKVKEDYLEILKGNDEQNKKIRILEIQENLAKLGRDRNYNGILEFAAIGLELDPLNTNILESKAWALWKTGDLRGSAHLYEKVLEIEPENTSAMWNVLELYLISNRINDYNELYSKNKTIVDSRDEKAITTYFEALKYYQLDGFQTMKNLISARIKVLPSGKKKRARWNFGDVLSYLQNRPDDKKKDLITIYIMLISGEIEKEEAVRKIDELTGTI